MAPSNPRKRYHAEAELDDDDAREDSPQPNRKNRIEVQIHPLPRDQANQYEVVNDEEGQEEEEAEAPQPRPRKRRRRRAPEERTYQGPSGYVLPPPQRITRGIAWHMRRNNLGPLADDFASIPYHGRFRERPPRPPPRPRPSQDLHFPNYAEAYANLAPADPADGGRRYQDATDPLRAAQNAALLQLATNNFDPWRGPGRGQADTSNPPSTWRRTEDGPQSHPIRRIMYGDMTDAARSRPGDAVVNLGLQNVTTAHRRGAPRPREELRGNYLTTVLLTTPLPDGHPLLRRAPRADAMPERRAAVLHHAHLPPDHDLIALYPGPQNRLEPPPLRVNQPVVEPEVAEGLNARMWGQRRGFIEDGPPYPDGVSASWEEGCSCAECRGNNGSGQNGGSGGPPTGDAGSGGAAAA